MGVKQCLPGRRGGEEDIIIATHMVGTARRRPKLQSTALHDTYGAHVSRQSRPPDPRRDLDKSVMLRGREQYLPELSRGVAAGRRI